MEDQNDSVSVGSLADHGSGADPEEERKDWWQDEIKQFENSDNLARLLFKPDKKSPQEREPQLSFRDSKVQWQIQE